MCINEMYLTLDLGERCSQSERPLHGAQQGEDFYTSLLQQGEEMKRLQKQLKKHGEEVSQPALKAKEMNTLPSDGTYISRSSATPNQRMYMWGENAHNDFLITLQVSF